MGSSLGAMCGIIAIHSRPSTRRAPTAAEVLHGLDRALAAAPDIARVGDEVAGGPSGARTSEVEVPQRDCDLPMPALLGREVSDDERFSGGRLAFATPEEAAQMM